MIMIGKKFLSGNTSKTNIKLNLYRTIQNARDHLFKRFGMEGKTHATNPTGECIDLTLYRSMIGSLPYITTSRPNILLSVGVYARFQANPKESHLTAVKKKF